MHPSRFQKLPRNPRTVVHARTSNSRVQMNHEPDQATQLKPVMRPLRIVVPPGIGDIHWVLLRLQGILRASGNDKFKPHIFVCSGDPAYDRSAEFVKMVPWVEFGGYVDIRRSEWKKYTTASFFHGKIFRGVNGFDLFIAVNKHVEQGMQFDSILPEAGPTNWDYDLHIKEDEIKVPSKFILATFYRASFYEGWWKEASPFPVLQAVGDRLPDDFRILLVGAKWDQHIMEDLQYAHPKCMNYAGQTTFQQLMFLKNRCAAFIGHPSGSGMLAQHMGCPTILMWGDWWQFKKGMWTNWARPEMKESGKYIPVSIYDEPAMVADALREILR